MIKHFSKGLLAFTLLFNLSVAYPAWYIGLGGGSSSYDAPDEVNDLGESVDFANEIPGIDASFELEDSDTAFKIFARNEISESLAIELGYVDLGEIAFDFSLIDDGSFTLDPSTTIISASDSASGFNLGLVGGLPVSDTASLNGRLGLYFWDVESDFSVEDTTGFFGNGSASSSESGSDIYYGVGLDIGWFGLFYEIYDIDGEDVDFAGVSVKFEMN